MFKRFLLLLSLALSAQIGQICAIQTQTTEPIVAEDQENSTAVESSEETKKKPETLSERLQKKQKRATPNTALKAALWTGGALVAGTGIYLAIECLGFGARRVSLEEDESYHHNPAIWSHAALRGATVKTDDECNRMANALWAAAAGDALGRLTEFNKERVGRFQWFMPEYRQRNARTNQQVYAYSDDTVMAHIVFEVLADNTIAQINKIDVMAERFIQMYNGGTTFDPLTTYRAHGNSIKTIAQNYTPQKWSDRLEKPFDPKTAEMGSGSVMRVWPMGFFYSNNLPQAKHKALQQSQITHRNVTAIAACAAMTVGFACLCNNPKATGDQVADAMIAAAREYDQQQIAAGFIPLTDQEKQDHTPAQLREHITANNMLTSQMLWYAKGAGQHSDILAYSPADVLNNQSSPQTGGRSLNGCLRGWVGDEAVAAALYIFMRYADQSPFTVNIVHAAIMEAVNTYGDSDTIATLVGALMGYRYNGDLCRDMQARYGADPVRLEWEEHMHALYA